MVNIFLFRTVGSCGMNPGNQIAQLQVGDQVDGEIDKQMDR